MSLRNGERQVAPSVDGIRRDHVARYEFAASKLKPGSKVLDLACGVGYGSDILARAGHIVVGVDNNREAIEYAKQHYAGNGALFKHADARGIDLKGFDAVVCFETIEHIEKPEPLLRAFNKAVGGAGILLASVPNETVFPHEGRIRFHHRHYTKDQFSNLLTWNGWKPVEWYGQEGPESEVEKEVEGRTVIAVCEARSLPREVRLAPEHVSIVGLGPSSAAYLEFVKRLGDRHVFSDEVWAINGMASVIACDRIFHMDDVRVQETRANANPDGNIAAMLRWLRTHPGPIYTSVARAGYPGLVAFPLEDVLNGGYDSNGGAPYFNNTAAYAIAYAIHIGVKKISLFGIDFTYPNAHQSEQGRACCEFWLGIAAARGIEILIPEQSSLMDACAPERERLYGYDCCDVVLKNRDDGGVAVEITEREEVPTAEEIEARYDHTKHPNRLINGETAK